MGVSSNSTKIITILKIKTITEERFNDILTYYKGEGKITKENQYFAQHSIIISLTMREIENILKELNDKDKNNEKNYNIPQYNFNLKKKCSIKFNKIVYDEKFKSNLEDIKQKLCDSIEIEEITKKLETSIIDNIINPKEKDFFIQIIKNAHNCNFHKFFIDYYIHEIIQYKWDGKNINTKEFLTKLKMAKNITQILISINLFIKHSIMGKDPVTKEERDEFINGVDKENENMTNFLLFECNKEENDNIIIETYLQNDNIEVIEELSLLYQKLLEIIERIKSKVNI